MYEMVLLMDTTWQMLLNDLCMQAIQLLPLLKQLQLVSIIILYYTTDICNAASRLVTSDIVSH